MKKLLGPMMVWMLACPAALLAQTNDHMWRSWLYSVDGTGARAAGMGGAFAAVADDATLVMANPAGLTSLSKTELSAHVLARGSGARDNGDTFASKTGPGFIGGAGLVLPRLAIGGYIAQPRAGLMTLGPAALPDGSSDGGTLDYAVTEGGGAIAYRLGGGWSVGALITATHLRLSADYSRTRGGVVDLRTGSASGKTRITETLGFAFDRGAFRAAVVIRPGASFRADRTSTDPVSGSVLDTGSEYDVRAPSTASGALAYRVSPRVLVVGQLDAVRYSEVDFVPRQLAAATEAQYATNTALEPRAGIEVSIPSSAGSIQFRAGVRGIGERAAYIGPDPVDAVAFAAIPRETHATAGLGLFLRSGLHLDAAGDFAGTQTTWTIGAGVRF
jgi:long-subunit fatty acid transport protein